MTRDLVREPADPPRRADEREHGVGDLGVRAEVEGLELALKRMHLGCKAALCAHEIASGRMWLTL